MKGAEKNQNAWSIKIQGGGLHRMKLGRETPEPERPMRQFKRLGNLSM